MVTLQAPLSVEAAHDTVSRFFDAVTREDITAMSAIVRFSAIVQDTGGGSGPRSHAALTLWRQRFAKREHQPLASRTVYRRGDVTTFRGESLDSLPLEVRHLDPMDATAPSDVVLRVPISTTAIQNERLFGDELFFWLRREGDHYQIYRMAEDIPY